MDSTIGRGNFSKDFLSLLTRVNHKVSKKNRDEEDGEEMQIPEICSRLTKDLYFT